MSPILQQQILIRMIFSYLIYLFAYICAIMTELTTLEFLWLTLDSRLAGSFDMQHIVMHKALTAHLLHMAQIQTQPPPLAAIYSTTLLSRFFSFLANSALESLASGKKPT